jgi:cysteine-rich repeat protein
MRQRFYKHPLYAGILICFLLFFPLQTGQALEIATTTLTISICGDSIVNAGEECDNPGETGEYSTTITGRQCTAQCFYGPYCGDAILQTSYDEECDDGNNEDGDFCSAECTAESSGGGGGSASGGGSGGDGGSDTELGDTQVSITGKAYPNSTVNILMDGDLVGTVRANGNADFSYATDAEPGTISFGFWANDGGGTRSITLNTTFDVTQGAITNISGILLPPTIKVEPLTVDRGSPITFSGRTVPNAVHIDGNQLVEETTANSSGQWTIPFDTGKVSQASHTARPRFEYTAGGKTTDSNFGQTLTFFVGVAPTTGAISSSDLNSDGKVNLTDFSILIFWWGSNGGNSSPSADINGNSKVGLEDFSILLFNWTGQ